MGKRKHKRKTEYQTKLTKAVFLYGRPNKEKAALLSRVQELFLSEVNRFIQILTADDTYLFQIACGNCRVPVLRALEKETRNKDNSATFSQAAFDYGFTRVATRMDNIRKEIMSVYYNALTKSKALFGMVLTNVSRDAMLAFLNERNNELKKPSDKYTQWISELSGMSEDTFTDTTEGIRMLYHDAEQTYKVPQVKRAGVRLVSTNFRFSLTESIKAGAVIEISLPQVKGYITIPLETSGDAKRRLLQYGACHSAEYEMLPDGKLKVVVAFEKKVKEPETTSIRGVDVGISDALHVDQGGAISSMRDVIQFYKEEVEPLFAEKSALVNKKRKLKKYLKHHPDVPADVKRSIRKKIDHLETMLRGVKKAYRRNRRYHAMLKKRIKDVVSLYIRSLKGDHSVLTALELLDIKEFNRSRKVNGMFSTFARGQLTTELMNRLNWNGYAFVQVEPAYTSQECPVCRNIDEKNRSGKTFLCTCCHHQDDADHVGSVNIRSRASDEEIREICETLKYNKKARHQAIKELAKSRHEAWQKMKAIA